MFWSESGEKSASDQAAFTRQNTVNFNTLVFSRCLSYTDGAQIGKYWFECELLLSVEGYEIQENTLKNNFQSEFAGKQTELNV